MTWFSGALRTYPRLGVLSFRTCGGSGAESCWLITCLNFGAKGGEFFRGCTLVAARIAWSVPLVLENLPGDRRRLWLALQFELYQIPTYFFTVMEVMPRSLQRAIILKFDESCLYLASRVRCMVVGDHQRIDDFD